MTIKILVLNFLIGSIFLSKTFACTCGDLKGPATIKDYNETAIIFSGNVTQGSGDGPIGPALARETAFRVTESFKGLEGITTVVLNQKGSNCDLNFKIGDSWIIWAFRTKTGYETSMCSRSRLFSSFSAEDLKIIRNIKKAGNRKEWFAKGGEKIAAGSLYKGDPVGLWTYYFKNGSIAQRGTYLAGLKDGKWYSYNVEKPEVLQAIVSYAKDMFDGESIYYYSSGKPLRIQQYKNGQAHGYLFLYFENGMVHYQQQYNANELEGTEREFFPNGQLKQEGNFLKGQPVGLFKVYDENGIFMGKSLNERPQYNHQTKKYNFN